jgi:two-component system nitrogen regulation sensor histidine kinase NtrY
VDNAVGAFEVEPTGEKLRIVIKTAYDLRRKLAILEVLDNGPGLKDLDKVRIFEPYFTTKRKGTGLGLAIVTSIIADHQGKIRAENNEPRGAKFIVELPIEPKMATQRRFAAWG